MSKEGLTGSRLHTVLSAFVSMGSSEDAHALHSHVVEGPKGETMYMMSWGLVRAWRCRVRPADGLHLLALCSMAIMLTTTTRGSLLRRPLAMGPRIALCTSWPTCHATAYAHREHSWSGALHSMYQYWWWEVRCSEP